MDMNLILQRIRKTVAPRKTVNIDEVGLHFELELLTTLDEVKIAESLKEMSERIYIQVLKKYTLACSIKKITMTEEGKDPVIFDLSQELIEYVEDDTVKTKSCFLYMLDFLGKWPNAIIDILFDAYSDMLMEVEDKVKKSSKFERFLISEKPAEDKEPSMRKIKEPEPTEEDLTEAERMERQVKREIEEADMQMAEKEMKRFK